MNRVGKIWLIGLALAVPACSKDFGKSDDDDDAGGTPDAGDDGDAGDAAPVNQPPVAVDDTAETTSAELVEIWLTSNDSDPEDDALAVTEIVQPENGFVEILLGEERVEYTSEAGFVGVDTFEYTVSDGNGGTDQGSVSVNVEAGVVLTLEITSPIDAEVVEGPDVRIEFEVGGCTVTRPAVDAAGCHVHKFLDGAEYSDADGTGFGHYSPVPFTITPISEGEHEFTLELISNDGTDLPVDPYVADSVTFTVTLPAG